jgi:basic membrane lipoprotein Med (substrate-binding protein (PBP1-ABC) superfamily)
MAQSAVRRRRARTLAVAWLVVMALFAFGCGGDDDDDAGGGGEGSGGGSDEPISVGMALAAPKNDQGFAQAHYEGLVAAEDEFDIEISVQENVADPQARVDAMRDLAVDNDLVIGVGAEFAEAGTVVAPQFPDVTFMVVNGEESDAENLHVYGVREGVPAYIAGVVAATMVESGKAGFVGGEEIPPLAQAEAGFTGGLNQDAEIEVTSTVVGSFTDPQGAYAAASAQIASGATAIYSYVDSGIAGVIEAIEDSGQDINVFGIIFPRCDDFPQIIGTSILNASALVVSMVRDFVEDTVPDEPSYAGVEDPDIQRFELCPDHSTPELEQLVEDTTAGINSGDIELPDGV